MDLPTTRFGRRWPVNAGLTLWLLLVSACSPPAPPEAALSAADSLSIRQLNETYVRGWLDADTAAVLSVLDEEAVLMPSGLSPLVGVEAIREFWFPDDGSRTVIEDYQMQTSEIGGSSTFAYSRGIAELSFRYETDDQVVRQTNHTMYLTVYRKGVEGEWRMIRRMWGPTQ